MQKVFEQIMTRHTEKQVVSLCKKCLKKLSFKSSADMENLSDLCFWLFILDDREAALNIASLTHGVPFDHNFSVWDRIHEIWALEVYILRKSGDTPAANGRRNAILANLRQPGATETQEEHDRRNAGRYRRMEYREWTYRLDIDKAVAAGDMREANAWRLSALKRMTGYGETGLYPDFVAHDGQREAEILQYAGILSGREAAPEPKPDSTIVTEKRLPKKFRDACTLILRDREAGVNALNVPAFDTFARQRDAVMAELAYFDGDFPKALQLDMSLCPWWGEWHYSNVRTEHIAAMTFAAFRLGKEAELAGFFREQIAMEQSRTEEKEHIIKANVRGYELEIEKLEAGYERTVAAGQPCSQLPKEPSIEALMTYIAGMLWRVASFTQVRPMTIFGDTRLYPLLTEHTLKRIAAAVNADPPHK